MSKTTMYAPPGCLDPSHLDLRQLQRRNHLYLNPRGVVRGLDELPDCSAVYFCLSIRDECLYIGKAECLRERWRRHHRYAELVGIDAYASITWQECAAENLDRFEKTCIAHFRPRFNETPDSREIRFDTSTVDGYPALFARRSRRMTVSEVARRDLGRYYHVLHMASMTRPIFSVQEALLLLDAVDGPLSTTSDSPYALSALVRHAMEARFLDDVYEVDGDTFAGQLHALTPLETMSVCDVVDRCIDLIGDTGMAREDAVVASGLAGLVRREPGFMGGFAFLVGVIMPIFAIKLASRECSEEDMRSKFPRLTPQMIEAALSYPDEWDAMPVGRPAALIDEG